MFKLSRLLTIGVSVMLAPCVGLDPEIVDVGVHAAFGPIFGRNLTFQAGSRDRCR